MRDGHVLVIGSPWIMRQGVRKLLKRIDLSIIAEGDDYEEACINFDRSVDPILVLIIVSRAEHFTEGLNALRAAATRFSQAKLVLLVDEIDDGGILAAASSGAHALLSPKLSSDMLGNSLQLVLMNQNLFPTPPFTLKRNIEGSVDGNLAESVHKGEPGSSIPERKAEPVSAEGPREARILLGQWPDGAPPPARPPSTLLNLVWNSSEPVVTNSPRPLTPSDREWEILQCLANGEPNKSIARQLGIAETTVKVHVKSLLRKLGVANRTQAAIWALNHVQPTAGPVLEEPVRAAQGE